MESESSDDSLISSDSDVDLFVMNEALGGFRSPRVFATRKFDEDIPLRVYKERYRIMPEAVDYLTERLSPFLEHDTKRNSPLTSRQQILLFLNFVGCNNFYHCERDIFGVSKDTVSRTIRRTSAAILTLRDEFVCWPSNPETIAQEFMNIAGFPSVCAAIDGSHIPIMAPKADEASYLSRKQDHTINALLVCGPSLDFFYVNANFAGRAHDSRILRSSSLWRTFEEDQRLPFPGAVILGDSAFPLRPWLLTPYPTSEGFKEKYNSSHVRTRNTIERAIGVLKKRFYCLATRLRVRDVHLASELIVCCVILNNIAIRFGDLAEDLEDNTIGSSIQGEPQSMPEEVSEQGRDDRRQQILEFFSS